MNPSLMRKIRLGGAATVFNESGHLALNSTRVHAAGTSTAGLGSVSGQTSIESGGTLAWSHLDLTDVRKRFFRLPNTPS